MANIHENYVKLTDVERYLVDDTMSELFKIARVNGVRLKTDDAAEKAADALAAFVIASRK